MGLGSVVKGMGRSSNAGQYALGWLAAGLFFFAPVVFSQDASPTNQLVHIGILAKRGRVLCLQKWTATADYLTEQLPGYSFEIVPLDFSEIKAAVDSREVEFFVVNSSFYVDLERRSGAMRIATLKNLHLNGTVHKVFAGTIFCKADRSDIRGVNDLKNKSFMAVDERSLGGWHMAWREFVDEGSIRIGIFPSCVLGEPTMPSSMPCAMAWWMPGRSGPTRWSGWHWRGRSRWPTTGCWRCM